MGMFMETLRNHYWERHQDQKLVLKEDPQMEFQMGMIMENTREQQDIWPVWYIEVHTV